MLNPTEEIALSRLPAPSVQATIIYGDTTHDNAYVKPNLRNLMIKCRYSLQKLEEERIAAEDDYQALLEGIPNLVSLKEIRISLAPSEFLRNTRFRNVKAQLFQSLSQNLSIEYHQGNDLIWAVSEREQLKYWRQRNKGIAALMHLPESISISAWPLVMQAIPDTNVGRLFMFQCVHKITGMLLQNREKDDCENEK